MDPEGVRRVLMFDGGIVCQRNAGVEPGVPQTSMVTSRVLLHC